MNGKDRRQEIEDGRKICRNTPLGVLTAFNRSKDLFLRVFLCASVSRWFNYVFVLSCLLLFASCKGGKDASAIFGDRFDDMPYEEMIEIPAGSFIMGSIDGEFDEKPLHKVELDGFYMDRYEVTNLQYQRFILANPHWQKGNPRFDEADGDYLKEWNGSNFPEGKENHPVTYVSWYAAVAYCKWAEKSLPTEPQWEYAARGGYEGMKYGGGNFPETYLIRAGTGIMPVGSFAMNGLGINDLAGNVWEWTSDGYELYWEGEEKNPKPRLNNHLKVIRGGSWKSNMNEIRVSIRRTDRPNACRGDIGFRCMKIGRDI